MTISYERRKAQIREYRKRLFARKADCLVQKCREKVVVYRHLSGETVPLCAGHDEKYRAIRREYERRSDYDLRVFLESL
mgnify:CR=1 FL=1